MPLNDPAKKLASDPLLSAIPHVDQLFGPWAIYEPAMDALRAQIELLDLSNHLNSPQAIAARERASQLVQLDITPDQVAIVRIVGSMQKQESSFGGASTVSIRKQLREAARNESVKAIMLWVESPGGTVAGTSDLADDIVAASKKKLVHAYVEDLGASAAYWAVSQASRISVNRTGQVGSIGTFTVVQDFTRQADARGVKVHVVRAGTFKGTGTPGTEITAEQLAMIQTHIDQLNEHFLQGVATGRNMKLEDVRQLADGRVHIGAEAKRLGLVDAVSTFDEAMASLVTLLQTQKRGSTMSEQNKTERVLATATEIKAGCPGATSDFIVAQLERGATIAEAQGDWMREQAKATEKMQAELKAEKEKTATAEAKAQEAEAKLKKGKAGVDPVGAGASADSEDYSGDAIADWNQKKGDLVAKGMTEQAAVKQLVRNYPDLHAAYTAAYTDQFGPACGLRKR